MVRNTRILYSYLFAMALVFAACKDEESLTVEQALVGTWTISQANIEMSVGALSLSDYLVNELDFTPAEASALVSSIETELLTELSGSITFNSDDTYTSNIGGNPDSGTWDYSAFYEVILLDPGTSDAFELSILSIAKSNLVINLLQLLKRDLDDDGSTPDTSILVTATIQLTK